MAFFHRTKLKQAKTVHLEQSLPAQFSQEGRAVWARKVTFHIYFSKWCKNQFHILSLKQRPWTATCIWSNVGQHTVYHIIHLRMQLFSLLLWSHITTIRSPFAPIQSLVQSVQSSTAHYEYERHCYCHTSAVCQMLIMTFSRNNSNTRQHQWTHSEWPIKRNAVMLHYDVGPQTL